MVKFRNLCDLRLLLLLVLLPCVLFGALADFTRDIREIDLLSFAVSGGETSDSGETALLISGSLLSCIQPQAPNRGQTAKWWRQFLSLIVLVLFLRAFNKIMLRKQYLHNYFPRKFFHTLVISLLLGGRAPPSFANKHF
jgi:hypothetical protein